MRGGWVLAGSMLLACGHSDRRSGVGSEDAAGAPTAGGAGGMGGVGGSAGLSTTDPGCAGYSTTSGCIDCLTDEPLAVNAVCEDGAWLCPPGSTRFSECPPESCYGVLSKCCDAATGADVTRVCGEDGMLEACPSGSEAIERGGLCLPEAVEAESCDVLQFQPCADTSYRCSQGGGCGRVTCECTAGPDGATRWECSFPIC